MKKRLLIVLAHWLATLQFAAAASGSEPPQLFGQTIDFGIRPPRNGNDGTLDGLLTGVILENIPHRYEDKRDWGMTSERWDGLHIQLDGLKLKTKRRKKTVNHGTWKMYRIDLVNPNEEFRVRLENGRITDDGFVSFDLVTTAKLHAFGRVSKWVKGVQLYSFSADADAKAQLRLACRFAVGLDPTKLPPDIVFVPEVTGADLRLVEFEVQRISDVGGKIAEELGRGVRRIVEDKLDEKRDKLVERINRKLGEKDDDLRLSLHDLAIDKWRALTTSSPGANFNN